MDIILKPLELDDIELVRNWRNSPEVAQYMYTEDHINSDQQLTWYEKIKNDSSQKHWIIQYDNKPIGLASISDINYTLSSCYWAFYLGDISIRGAGIGSKVEYNILQYVFEELKLNKLRCEVLVSNPKVIGMHEKFGFRREAYYRQHVKKNGIFKDAVGLAIIERDWKQIRDLMKLKIYKS